MKKVFLLFALLLTSVSIWAQKKAAVYVEDGSDQPTIVAEKAWTQESAYYDDVWYSDGTATVSVETGLGLIIDSNPPEDAGLWDVQVPMIAHIPEVLNGGKYELEFTVNAPADGEIRLDFCSWETDATKDIVLYVSEGDNTFTVDFSDYPGYATNAMIFYQCGHVPGRHIIKNVQVLYYGGGTYEEERHNYSVIGTIVGNWDIDTDMYKNGGYYYTATFDNVPGGCYEFKIRQDYDWTVNWGQDGVQDGTNIEVCLENDGRITINFNPTTGEILCEVSTNMNHTPGEPVDPSLFKNLADNKALIAGFDYTGVEGGFPFYAGFGEYQEGTVVCTDEGIAINVESTTGQPWNPQIMVVPETYFDLEEGNEYRVVVTAKFPTSGTLQMNMGSWGCNYQYATDVQSTGDFQDVEIEFPYTCTTSDKDAHLLLQCGDFLGTTIVKKVEIYNVNAIPVDTLLYQSKEWAGVEDYPYYYSDEEYYTATMGEEGLELYNGREGWWTPLATILDGATLIKGHNYKVVVTAKVPSESDMEILFGDDNRWNEWRSAHAYAGDEFQEITFRISDVGSTINRNAKVRIHGYSLGTTIIQKVEIFDVEIPEVVAYQSKDWTNCSEKDLPYYSFEGQEGTVEATADGIAITNKEYNDTYWYVQTSVIDNIVLKSDHQYKVRITAKIPSEGRLYLKVGNTEDFSQYSTWVYPSNEFQEIEYDFRWYNNDGFGDDYIWFQNARIPGTTVVKKIEIFDMSMLTEYDIMAMTGKIVVKGTQELDFPEETDPEFKPSIELSHADNYDLGRLTLNGYVPAISDISMWYDFARASDYGRYYEEQQQYDSDRQFYTSFINNAATSIDDANIKMRLMPDRWEFITLPFDVALKDVKSNTDAPFVVRKYDGQKRAEGLLDETWVDMTEDDILKAGEGYIWQVDYNNAQYDEWFEYYWCTIFNIKPAKDASLDRVLKNENITIPLAVHEGEFDYNLGWNLVGNPYPSYFDSRAMGFGAPFIVWSNYYRNYEAFSPVDDAYILNPGQAFFVQSTEDQTSITFQKEGRQSDLTVRSDVAYNKRARQSAAMAERMVVNFTVSNGEFGDRTRVVINPEASIGYEADKDANKFMSSEAKIQLYTIEQNVNYAINERPLSRGEVQLGMNCSTRGTYTLTMVTGADCTVKLLDRQTGEEVMLANGDTYTFESETGVFDNRFTLYFTSGEATGIQNFSNTQGSDNTYYDMQGRRISKPEKGIYIQNGKKVVVK